MSADYSDAVRKLSPALAKAMDELTSAVTSEAVERVFGEWPKAPMPAHEPVSHLMLGRSEPVRLPSGAFACWDDPLAGDDDEEDEPVPVPSLRRPVPITNVDQELVELPPPPGFAELQAWMDKAQEDVRRAFAMPNWMIRTDPGFCAMIRDTPMGLVMMVEKHDGR